MKGIKQKFVETMSGFVQRQPNPEQWLLGADTSLVCFFLGICATLLCADLVNIKILLFLLCCIATISIRNVIALPLFLILLGFTWASLIFTAHFKEILPSVHEGQTIMIVGSLADIPDIDSNRSRFDFRIDRAATAVGDPIKELENKKVVISCYRCPLDFAPGQLWQLFVRLKRPHSYASWAAFDYEKYLFRHKIIATGYIRVKEDNVLLSDIPSTIGFSANQWRWRLRTFINQNVSAAPAGKAILAALMIGDKSLLSQQQNSVFQKTGVSHLMAISGLHIGLAFVAAMAVLKLCFAPFVRIYNWAPRQRLVLIPALIVALSYAALAGFAISTQRAIIMLCIYVLIRLLCRQANLFRVLLFAVCCILIYDPFSILDIGFWLSCSAVFIIALISVNRTLKSEGEVNNQGLSLVRLQPALWLGLLPITLLFFGKVSLISPFVNLLLVPLFCIILIPVTLLVLWVEMLGLSNLSSSLIALLAVIYEHGYQMLAWVAELSFAQLALPPMAFLDWLLFALIGFAFYFTLPYRQLLVLVFLVCFFWINKGPVLEASEYNVALLDVGQGLAMVVETQDTVLVYDTGPAYASGFNTAEAVLIPYLNYRGIKQINTLIVSHADSDHIGGFSALAEAFPIDKILTSRVDKIPQAQYCERGQTWTNGDISFSILSPDQATPAGSNNLSCVLKISNGQVDTLITGDIEKPVEKYLLDQGVNLSATILLVPHQGSKTSSTSAFVDAVDPKIALVAAGYRNHYGHPHSSVVARFREKDIELYSTIDYGSILLNIKNKNIQISPYRVSEKGFWQRPKKPT